MLFLNVENANLATNKVLKWLRKFRKITDYEVNMHKSIVFPFMGGKQLENKMLENNFS